MHWLGALIIRDDFVEQWSRFASYHWGDLAYSTLRGAGSYDDVHGGELNRAPAAAPPRWCRLPPGQFAE